MPWQRSCRAGQVALLPNSQAGKTFMPRARNLVRFACVCSAAFLLGTTAARQKAGPRKTSGAEPPQVNFVDIARKAGLTVKTEDGGEKAKKYIVETTGSGAAFFDYDNDGWPDIFLVNGTTLEGFPKGQEPVSHLYHNNHDGTFTDVTQKAGLSLTGWGQGVCAGDYDNDGRTDLFVTYWGHSVLLHNNGDGTFSDVTKKAGLWRNDVHWETGCAFVDYDRDGRVDLFVSQYVDLDLANTPVPGSGNNCIWKGIPVMCGPRGLKGTHSELFHNNGDGTFTDATDEAGLGANTQSLGWGTLFVDVDNDGWPDIFMANGHVYPEVDGKDFSTSFRERKTLYWNRRNGKFRDISLAAGSGVTALYNGHGVAAADFDNDGAVEILVNNSHDAPSLLKNYGEHQNWLLVKLTGTRSNRDAIGARVTVRANGHQQTQEVRSGGGYISQTDFRLHFGLGEASKADVIEIRWPSGGAVERRESAPANRSLGTHAGSGPAKR